MGERETKKTEIPASGAVDFLQHFASSHHFQAVFDEGMSLVEETANYLDGRGRSDARSLDRTGVVAYATESMRLTTRLMQLASWLLLQRAVSQGDLTDHAAQVEKSKINLLEVGGGTLSSTFEGLPETLRALVERSFKLHQRVMTLDHMIAGRLETGSDDPVNPVAQQVRLLEEALSSLRKGAPKL